MRINVYGLCHAVGILVTHYIFTTCFLGLFAMTHGEWARVYALGVVLCIMGGRLMCGLQRDVPWGRIHRIWDGGLSSFGSYHTGLFYLSGVALLYGEDPVRFVEAVTLSVSLYPVFIRLGNWWNGELRGVFGPDGHRHPSQLYELLLEGVLVSGVLWSLSATVGDGIIFLTMPAVYGGARSVCETFKEEDPAMPCWYRIHFHRYLRWVRFQAFCLVIASWAMYSVIRRCT